MNQHDHASCIKEAIEKAQTICEERGSRFTPLRRIILGLIWSEHKAIKAYDLLDKLAEIGEGSAKPPTVYRALDFLMDHGLVHKVESLNAYVGCPHPEEGHLFQFLICKACKDIVEITVRDASKSLLEAADRADFLVKSQIVELHGYCHKCAR